LNEKLNDWKVKSLHFIDHDSAFETATIKSLMIEINLGLQCKKVFLLKLHSDKDFNLLNYILYKTTGLFIFIG